MAYSELIKNFDKIRSYMRDFYIYGFKTREEYNRKSARSYDNERRRIQSYLGNYISFRQTPTGKNVFISLDGRQISHNPLYKAFKAKSFTNKDITLHFIIMDILSDGAKYTLKNLLEIIDTEYLYCFDEPMIFDESTLRKKMKEYAELGIITIEKLGRSVLYRLNDEDINIEEYRDAIRFFSEENILGVVGSYLEDKMASTEDFLAFRNHYIMNAYDMEIVELLLQAIYEKRMISIINQSRKYGKCSEWTVIPIKIFVSTQGGRNYLICMSKYGEPMSFRIDYIQKVVIGEKKDNYDNFLRDYHKMSQHMWGVIWERNKKLEHIEIDIQVSPDENHIVRRLNREKRCGIITQVDTEIYRFTADVYDAFEMIPWIRSFFGRIKRIECSNKEITNQLKYDIVKMAKQYGVIK